MFGEGEEWTKSTGRVDLLAADSREGHHRAYRALPGPPPSLATCVPTAVRLRPASQATQLAAGFWARWLSLRQVVRFRLGWTLLFLSHGAGASLGISSCL